MTTDLRELLREARELLYIGCDIESTDLIARIDVALAEKTPAPIWCSITESGVAQIEDEETGELIASGLTPENASRILRAINDAPPPASPSEARDAARYRWLRVKMSAGSSRTARIEVWQSVDNPKCIHLEFDALDEAIDAAIEREGGA